MSRWLFALTILCSLSLIACGGGNDDDDDDDAEDVGEDADEDDESGSEDDLAQSLLLTVDDFPEGWTEEPDDDDDESPLDECDEEEPEGRAGEAETGSFQQDDSVPFVSQTLTLFEDSDLALEAFDRVQPLLDCLVDQINDGALSDDQAEFGDAELEELDFPGYGERSAAYRLAIVATPTDPEAPIGDTTTYFDLVFAISGRAAFVLGSFDVFSPFPEEELQRLTGIAADRAAEAE